MAGGLWAGSSAPLGSLEQGGRLSDAEPPNSAWLSSVGMERVLRRGPALVTISRSAMVSEPGRPTGTATADGRAESWRR